MVKSNKQPKKLGLKSDAILMRKAGKSITSIGKSLEIPKSTLSGWIKNVYLTDKQKNQLAKTRLRALKNARIKASAWHRLQKLKRLNKADEQAESLVSTIAIKDVSIREVALAMLYLGEGFKKNNELGLGNSDPLILKFFVNVLRTNFNIEKEKMRCELHLRADQNPEELKAYWSKQLHLPLKNFGYIHIDKRTVGSNTYRSYKGVCSVRCGNVPIQRKLLSIAKKYCMRVITTDD